MGKEDDYRKLIDPFFERYFNMEIEVWSTQKKRIDYVLQCKQSGALFGVEVKHNDHMRGEKMGQYLLQAHDYSKMYWKTKFSPQPVKLHIFITPALSNTVKQIIPETKIILNRYYCDGKFAEYEAEYYQAYHASDHEHTNINSWLSAFGIGEIRKLHNKAFIFSFNNKILWRSDRQIKLHPVNYNFYQNKLTCQTQP